MDAQSNGVGVALMSAAVGGGLFTLICRTRGLMAGGSMSFALIVAGVLSTLVQGGVLQPGIAGFPGALALIALLTLATALCEAGLAATGLGQVVSILPYPVVSGIRNGVALLMIALQMRATFGLEWSGGALVWAHPAALAVAAATFVLMLRPVAAAVRPLPPALVGLLAGACVHYLAAAALAPRGGGTLLGPLLDVPAGGVALLHALGAGLARLPQLASWSLAATIGPAALTIALVSTLETLVGASVMQDLSGEHGSSRADLVALAVANVGCGLCGTLPVTGGSSGSMAAWTAGGRNKAAGWMRAAVLLAAVLLAGPLIGLLPAAALAGMMVSNGLQAIDIELPRLARTAFARGSAGRMEMAGSLLVNLVVTGVAIGFGLVAAVLTGFMLSALLFIVAMSGGVVRRRYGNPGSRSRVVRSEAEAETLVRLGARIEVIELQGALFFGSADQLVREIERAWAGGARCVVLDFRRVSQVDLSGARRVQQAAVRYWQAGSFLALAELRPGSPVWAFNEATGLRARLRADRVFPRLGDALDAAERMLLAAEGLARRGTEAAPCALLERLGFTADEAAALLRHAPEHEFAAGSAIITAGEAADRLYILVEGEVEVRLPEGAEGAGARLATLTSGTLFGEMALLSGAPRSADVRAATAVRCLGVDTAAIALFRRTQPELAYRLMAAIAAQLAGNLSNANVALRSTEA